MDEHRIADILKICDGALERSGAARESYLDAECAADVGLRHEVEVLLARHTRSASFLDTPAWAPSPQAMSVGQRLGPYEVTGELGAGGMGFVYRARDTRLGRTVAVKVITGAAALDGPARDRLLREARAIAALNDPRICALHDIGRDNDIDFLVMEYVEGETLSKKLLRGPLPMPAALEYGAQLAEALSRVHHRGIVHRDIKPANIMLTKAGVKLLDFGLARLAAPGTASVGGAGQGALGSETGPLRETQIGTRVGAPETAHVAGAVHGTLPYMAPEQLMGQPTDARTDVFAFGCVLYEMATGARAFDGENTARIGEAILAHQPLALCSRLPLAPPQLDHLVARCLAKDPDERWQSLADVAANLRWLAQPVAAPGADVRAPARPVVSRRGLRTAALALAGILAVAAITVGLTRVLLRSPREPVYRFAVTPASLGLSLTEGGIAISPDGRTLAFTAFDGRSVQLYVQRLDEWNARPLQGTEGGSAPFFSADGQWIGYSREGGGLAKMPLSGGPPQVVWAGQRVEGRIVAGAAWIPDGIIFGRWPQTGLWFLPSERDKPWALTHPGTAGVWHVWPEALPDGRGVLCTIWRRGKTSIAVSLPSGETKPILPSATRARYLPTGHLLYETGGNLLAVPFDDRTLETHGTARTVLAGVGKPVLGGTLQLSQVGRAFDVSPTGTLVYSPQPDTVRRLVWRDRQGRATELPLEHRSFVMPALSPDGRRVAAVIQDGLVRNIWVGNVEGGEMMRVTPGDDDCHPLFSRDGRWVYYTSNQDDRYNVYRIPSDGSGPPERVTDSPHSHRPSSLSPGDDVLLANDILSDASDSRNVNIVGIQIPSRRAFDVLATPFWERNAVFSPDGRYIAYETNESGRMEVYVQAYPHGGRAKVSRDGGQWPVWNPKGGELFFKGSDSVMAVGIANGVPTGPAIRLFPDTTDTRDWDVAPDGSRFLVAERGDAKTPPRQIQVIVNWFEELKSLLPSPR